MSHEATNDTATVEPKTRATHNGKTISALWGILMLIRKVLNDDTLSHGTRKREINKIFDLLEKESKNAS